MERETIEIVGQPIWEMDGYNLEEDERVGS